ncbi:MAG: COX15/CtaA family protein [Candidatus Rokubacteria bacterium]|nr:COX15/CtaA family protein [Candidatus Rokubacteria bacterium]
MAYRLALVTASATLVLILFGGLVTNTGAALAVPDWPTTFGYNMFLYPWSQMVGGVFYEHSHRLIGAAVGFLTLGLAAALWRAGGRLRWLGAAAVVAVLAQGVLGGLRVILVTDTLAIVHGALAQAFFALLVGIAWLTSAGARRSGPGVDPSLRAATVLAALLVYLQIVFGALVTHAGRLDLHLAGALAVYVVVPLVTARLGRSGDPVVGPVSRALLVLLVLQLLLGAGSFLARFSWLVLPGGQVVMVLLPVAHRVAGSLVLGAAVVLAARVAARPGSLARSGGAMPWVGSRVSPSGSAREARG